jgi:hypothetical protein
VQQSGTIVEGHFPKFILMCHSWDNANCPYNDTKGLFDLLATKYPVQYYKTHEEAEDFARESLENWKR